MRVEANVSLRPVGHGGLRHPGRGQEHELVPKRGAGHRVRDRAPDASARRRRAAGPGDPRLGRRPRPHLPDAGQGDLGRLPLLPGPRPAAVARGRRRCSRPSARRCRSCPRRGASALCELASASRPTTRASSSPVAPRVLHRRGDRRSRPGAVAHARRACSPRSRCEPPRPIPALLASRTRSRAGTHESRLLAAGALTGANAKEVYQRHLETGESVDTLVARRATGGSPTPVPCGVSCRASSPRTRPPSRTCGPARSRRSGSSPDR